MNLFQWITLPILGLLVLMELIGLVRAGRNRPLRLLRCVVWLSAMVAIAMPDLTSILAHAVGITRGTDFVLYLFALAFLGVSFYFYSRYVRLQRQLTDVVRHIAIENGRQQRSVTEHE